MNYPLLMPDGSLGVPVRVEGPQGAVGTALAVVRAGDGLFEEWSDWMSRTGAVGRDATEAEIKHLVQVGLYAPTLVQAS
jgi:hypothetical protein